MKVRWTDGSVRFRITPRELDALVNGDGIRESLRLPQGAEVWSASIRPAPASEETRLDASGSGLCVWLAEADRARLAEPEVEGVYFNPEGGPRFYIEKDFPCLHPRPAEAAEPECQTFAPPADFAGRKGVKG